MSTSITFDTVQIQTSQYRPRFIQHEDAPNRNLFVYPVAREDGEVFVTELYGRKIIRVQGMLFGSSSADLDDKIDQFKELFSRREKNLDISWNNSTRRYVATCSKHQFNRDFYNINAVPWVAEFTVAQGVGIDTALTTGMVSHSLTTVSGQVSNYDYIANDVVTFSGSADPRPTITLTLSTIVSGMCGIEYQNTDTGERLVITRAQDWSGLSGKQIVISSSGYAVFDNFGQTALQEGTFYGIFPRFAVGRNNLRIKTGGFTNQGTTDTGGDVTLTSAQYTQISSDQPFATSFSVPYNDSTFSGIMFCLGNVGGVPSGDFSWQIVGDNGGIPDSAGTVYASGTLSRLLIPTSPTFRYIFVQSTAIFSLTANTTYWLIAKSASNDAAKTAVRSDGFSTLGYTPPQGSAQGSGTTSRGPYYPSTVVQGPPIKSTAWVNVSNMTGPQDGNYGVAGPNLDVNNVTDLYFSNWGIDIGDGARISTITVESYRKGSAGSLMWDTLVRLTSMVLNQNIFTQGDGFSYMGETWGSTTGAWENVGTGNPWDVSALGWVTPAVLRDPTLTFMLTAQRNSGVSGANSASIDAMRMTITLSGPVWYKDTDTTMSFKLVFGGTPKSTILTHAISYIKRWL